MEELLIIALVAFGGAVAVRNWKKIRKKEFGMDDLKKEVRDIPKKVGKMGGAVAAKVESIKEEKAKPDLKIVHDAEPEKAKPATTETKKPATTKAAAKKAKPKTRSAAGAGAKKSSKKKPVKKQETKTQKKVDILS